MAVFFFTDTAISRAGKRRVWEEPVWNAITTAMTSELARRSARALSTARRDRVISAPICAKAKAKAKKSAIRANSLAARPKRATQIDGRFITTDDAFLTCPLQQRAQIVRSRQGLMISLIENDFTPFRYLVVLSLTDNKVSLIGNILSFRSHIFLFEKESLSLSFDSSWKCSKIISYQLSSAE